MKKELLDIFDQYATYLNEHKNRLSEIEKSQYAVDDFRWCHKLTLDEAKLALYTNISIVEMNMVKDNKHLYHYKDINNNQSLEDFIQLKTTNTYITLNPVYDQITHPFVNLGIYNEVCNLLSAISKNRENAFLDTISNTKILDLLNGDIALTQCRINDLSYENKIGLSIMAPNDYLLIDDKGNTFNINESIDYIKKLYNSNKEIISSENFENLISNMNKLQGFEQFENMIEEVEIRNIVKQNRPSNDLETALKEPMSKEKFIDTFAHFMSESDLNVAYNSHFKEIGELNYFEIKSWLENIFNDDISKTSDINKDREQNSSLIKNKGISERIKDAVETSKINDTDAQDKNLESNIER